MTGPECSPPAPLLPLPAHRNNRPERADSRHRQALKRLSGCPDSPCRWHDWVRRHSTLASLELPRPQTYCCWVPARRRIRLRKDTTLRPCRYPESWLALPRHEYRHRFPVLHRTSDGPDHPGVSSLRAGAIRSPRALCNDPHLPPWWPPRYVLQNIRASSRLERRTPEQWPHGLRPQAAQDRRCPGWRFASCSALVGYRWLQA